MIAFVLENDKTFVTKSVCNFLKRNPLIFEDRIRSKNVRANGDSMARIQDKYVYAIVQYQHS